MEVRFFFSSFFFFSSHWLGRWNSFLFLFFFFFCWQAWKITGFVLLLHGQERAALVWVNCCILVLHCPLAEVASTEDLGIAVAFFYTIPITHKYRTIYFILAVLMSYA